MRWPICPGMSTYLSKVMHVNLTELDHFRCDRDRDVVSGACWAPLQGWTGYAHCSSFAGRRRESRAGVCSTRRSRCTPPSSPRPRWRPPRSTAASASSSPTSAPSPAWKYRPAAEQATLDSVPNGPSRAENTDSVPNERSRTDHIDSVERTLPKELLLNVAAERALPTRPPPPVTRGPCELPLPTVEQVTPTLPNGSPLTKNGPMLLLCYKLLNRWNCWTHVSVDELLIAIVVDLTTVHFGDLSTYLLC